MRARYLMLITLSACTFPLGAVSWASTPAGDAKTSRPVIGPVPAWVLPATIPPAPPAGEGASSVTLLSDSQMRLSAEGDSSYFDIAFKIASAQGLDDAPLQLSWDPSLETLTIHRYRILRDGKSLDLLGDGSKISVIQRERDMENATLDGELTATIQPDDVRVGDVIEMAFTRTRRDPAFAGHSEVLAGPDDGAPFGRLRVRLLWPDGKKVQWRALPGVLQPKLTHSAQGNELVADLTNVTTPVAPNAAPGRYAVVNAIEATDFPDWGSVSATMLPLYTKAATLAEDSPLRGEAKRIEAETTDPIHRAELALQLVQEQIRYLYVGMNDGGYVPAAADTTWSRRFGDCKGKTVLLMALLHEMGIQAEPVLVNTTNGDFVAHRLPAMEAFDHVLVRATIAGRAYWMDGTGLGDTKLARLQTPPYQVGLPIAQGTRGLITLTPDPLVQPSETVSMALDASQGIDAPAKAIGSMRFRGASASEMRLKYSGLSAADRDQQLRELWRKNFDQVAPQSITTATDQSNGDFVISMTGTAKMDWYADVGTRWYEVDRSRLGWKFDTDRPNAIEKDAPFSVDYPDYWESRETIKLPSGGDGFKLQGGSVDQTVGGIYAFHRKVDINGDTLTMEASTRALAPELPAAKAEQTRSDLAALQNDGVYIRVPDSYMATAADIAALQGNDKALKQALLHRGAVHVDRGELADSIADEKSVLAIEPDNAVAHSILALALALQGNAAADADADRALALDPKQALAWRAKGLLALNQKRYADSETDLSHNLDIDPKDTSALGVRASARLLLGRFGDALSDTDAALAISPDTQIELLRSTALAGLGRRDEALAEMDRAVGADPKDEKMRKFRAELRSQFGERDLAIADYSALIGQSPEVDYYIDRAALWGDADRAKRDSDLKAALALDPHSTVALGFRASIEIAAGDFAGAQADIDAIDKAEKDSDRAYQLKVQLLEKEARKREALALLDGYVAKHPDSAVALNNRCWAKATLNLEVDTALADCDAALKLVPYSAATLDSRGFARLRLGQLDAAIADYDSALKLAPALSDSLYGRAIARARKGDEAGAREDLAAARKLSSDIDARFASFGMNLPADLAGPGQPAAGAHHQ